MLSGSVPTSLSHVRRLKVSPPIMRTCLTTVRQETIGNETLLCRVTKMQAHTTRPRGTRRAKKSGRGPASAHDFHSHSSNLNLVVMNLKCQMRDLHSRVMRLNRGGQHSEQNRPPFHCNRSTSISEEMSVEEEKDR